VCVGVCVLRLLLLQAPERCVAAWQVLVLLVASWCVLEIPIFAAQQVVPCLRVVVLRSPSLIWDQWQCELYSCTPAVQSV
jgi:hypothetical protein